MHECITTKKEQNFQKKENENGNDGDLKLVMR